MDCIGQSKLGELDELRKQFVQLKYLYLIKKIYRPKQTVSLIDSFTTNNNTIKLFCEAERYTLKNSLLRR